MAVTDAICAVTILGLAHWWLSYRGGNAAELGLILVFGALGWVAIFDLFGLYDVHHLSAFEEFHRVVSATTVAAAAAVLLFWWDGETTRSALALLLVFGLAVELATRRVWRWNLRRMRRDGYLAMRTVIVGMNDEARRLTNVLQRPALGYRPVGYVATHASEANGGDLPFLGEFHHLDDLARESPIDCFFVVSSSASATETAKVAEVVRRTGADLRVSADLTDILTSRISIQPLDDFMTLSLKSASLTKLQAATKRTFDVVFASVALLLLLPLMGIIALAIRLTSRGPALFRQQRVTKDGHVFEMCKFRTMVVNQTDRLDGKVIDLTAPFFKMKDDPRLTRVGRWLRVSSLDELPQLWHVVRGQLSIVGPRPLPVEQVVTNPNVEGMRVRHEVRTGITGWWQVNGRSALTPEDALRLDEFYVNNWSFALDIYILLKTVGAVLAGRGAQ